MARGRAALHEPHSQPWQLGKRSRGILTRVPCRRNAQQVDSSRAVTVQGRNPSVAITVPGWIASSRPPSRSAA